MSLKNKFFSIITLAVAVVAFATIGFGQDKTTPTTPTDKTDTTQKGEGRGFGAHKGGREGFEGRGGPGMRGPGGPMGMFRGANLTDAQKAQVKSILEANRPDRSNMEAMRTIMKAKHDGTITADQEAQLKAFREQSRAKGKAVHEQLMAVLTPDQKAAMKKEREEMKLKREEFRKNRELRRATPPAATTDKPTNN